MPFLYLLYLFYGLTLLAVPFLLISLFVRQAKLRKQLNDLADENAKQFTKLQRAVGELQTKVAATVPSPAAAAEKPVAQEVHPPAPVPSAHPQVPAYPPVVVSPRVEVQPPSKLQPSPSIPPAEKKPEPAPDQKPLAPTPAAPLAPTPAAPLAPKPAVPVPQAPTIEAKPTPPSTSPKVTPSPAVPHTPTTPVIPPPQPAAIPPAATARISTPPTFSPLRTPAPRPTMKDRMKAISALEDALGTNWFAKLGGIMVVIGVTTMGLIKLQSFGAAGKAIVSYPRRVPIFGRRHFPREARTLPTSRPRGNRLRLGACFSAAPTESTISPRCASSILSSWTASSC